MYRVITISGWGLDACRVLMSILLDELRRLKPSRSRSLRIENRPPGADALARAASGPGELTVTTPARLLSSAQRCQHRDLHARRPRAARRRATPMGEHHPSAAEPAPGGAGRRRPPPARRRSRRRRRRRPPPGPPTQRQPPAPLLPQRGAAARSPWPSTTPARRAAGSIAIKSGAFAPLFYCSVWTVANIRHKSYIGEHGLLRCGPDNWAE